MPTCPGCHHHYGHFEFRAHMFRCPFLQERFATRAQPDQATAGSFVVANDRAVEELVEIHERRINHLEAQLTELQSGSPGPVDPGDGVDGFPE